MTAPRVHNRAAYVAGCHCEPCTDSNAAYVAAWRSTHSAAPVRPVVDLPQLSLFGEIAAVTAPDWISA